MPTNVYFNNYSPNVINEQRLMEDVIVESIQIMGHDCYFIPRESFNRDDYILGENVTNKFVRAYCIETYLANVEGYEGDGDFFSKFGLDIRDTSNFVISRRAFERYVPSNIRTRPQEGDLFYVPVIRKIFEIKFVEEELMFYSLGKRDPYIYELRCDMFRFSQENIETGNEEIDSVAQEVAYAIQLELGEGSGNFSAGERVYQGATLGFATASGEVKLWTPTTKTLEVINIIGTFAANSNVKSATSNAVYRLNTEDTIGFYSDYDITNNKALQDEGNTFIDFSERNPFGSI